MLELAWGIIANAHAGDWDSAPIEWKAAAMRWRERYHSRLKAHGTEGHTEKEDDDLSLQAFFKWAVNLSATNGEVLIAGKAAEEWRLRAEAKIERVRIEAFEAGAARALGVMVLHPAFIGTKLLDTDQAYRAWRDQEANEVRS